MKQPIRLTAPCCSHWPRCWLGAGRAGRRQEAVLLERERPQGLRRRAAGRSRRSTRAHRDQRQERLATGEVGARADAGGTRRRRRPGRGRRQKAAEAEARACAANWPWSSPTPPRTNCARAFQERIDLLDETVKASQLGVGGLRQSLVEPAAPGRRGGACRQAGEPAAAPTTSATSTRELQRQQGLLAQQQKRRAAKSTGDFDARAARATADRSKQPAARARRQQLERPVYLGSKNTPPSRRRCFGRDQNGSARSGLHRQQLLAERRPGSAPAPRVVGVEAQHQHRRGVRRAHQAPAVRPVHAQAVDGRQARAFELGRRCGRPRRTYAGRLRAPRP